MSNMDKDTMNRIFLKHAAALASVAQDERVHLDAARIVLALAMHEMNGDGDGEKPVDRRIHEQVTGQILRLNEWLAENAVDLYHEPYTDTGEAMVKAANRLAAQLAQVRTELAAAIDERNFADKRCAELEAERDGLRETVIDVQRELKHSQMERDDLREVQLHTVAERDALRLQLAQLDADNAALIRGNGKSAPAAVLMQAQGVSFGLDWSSLSQAAQDYRIGLDANRWKWKDIPRGFRLELVRCVIRNAGSFPTQGQFDAIRPAWMATADAQKAAFGVAWGILANLDREIEVAP